MEYFTLGDNKELNLLIVMVHMPFRIRYGVMLFSIWNVL